MCWSTSLYSSSTNHHLYRVQLFSDTNTRRKIEALEKKKSPSLFGKVNLFGLPVGRGTLDRPPLIWRRTLSTCTETSALPRENFLLFFSLPILGMSPYRWFTSDVLCSSYGQDDLWKELKIWAFSSFFFEWPDPDILVFSFLFGSFFAGLVVVGLNPSSIRETTTSRLAVRVFFSRPLNFWWRTTAPSKLGRRRFFTPNKKGLKTIVKE